jgi:Tfp pilus assembly protein PilN
MNFNFLNNISLLKLAGINKYICIDIHSGFVKFSCLRRKEPFYKIQKNSGHEEFEIVAFSTHTGNDLVVIEKIVKDFILKYSFNDAVIIAGINDFKFSLLQIPADTEDIDGWFSENRNKFLPEGRPADEFTFSYELYKKDENYKNYFVIIARSDFINSVYKACSSAGLKIICSLPFSLSGSVFFAENKNTLLLDFEEDKINYLFKSAGDNIIYQENYCDIFYNNRENNSLTKEKSLNINSLNNFIEEIKQTVTLSFGVQNVENIDIYIICLPEYYNAISSQIKKYFDLYDLYPKSPSENIYYTASIFAANKVIDDFNTTQNLLNISVIKNEREIIEKQTAFRIVLAAGVILITLLLVAYFSENYINDRLAEQETVYLESEAKAESIKNLKTENSYLKNNLKLLSELKGNRVEYSSLLFDITKTINYGSCLSSIKLKESGGNLIYIEYTGISESQRSLAEFISNMEHSLRFRDISLVYSALLKETRQNLQVQLQEEDYISFKMTAKYYADPQ